MQLEILDADTITTPEYFVGIVHRYVLDIYFVHFTEHLRPSDKFMERAQMVGMLLLFALLIWANLNDVLRFIF